MAVRESADGGASAPGRTLMYGLAAVVGPSSGESTGAALSSPKSTSSSSAGASSASSSMSTSNLPEAVASTSGSSCPIKSDRFCGYGFVWSSVLWDAKAAIETVGTEGDVAVCSDGNGRTAADSGEVTR